MRHTVLEGKTRGGSPRYAPPYFFTNSSAWPIAFRRAAIATL